MCAGGGRGGLFFKMCAGLVCEMYGRWPSLTTPPPPPPGGGGFGRQCRSGWADGAGEGPPPLFPGPQQAGPRGPAAGRGPRGTRLRPGGQVPALGPHIKESDINIKTERSVRTLEEGNVYTVHTFSVI